MISVVLKRVSILFTILLVVNFLVKAQTEKPAMVTDRPDQTETPVLVAKGGIQVELGAAVERDRRREVRYTNITYTTALMKYGVNENFEMRMCAEYLGERRKVFETNTTTINGLSPLSVGVKIKLAEEKGCWPHAAMIGHINLRSGSAAFVPDHTAADFRFTFSHNFSKKLSLNYNVGTKWNGKTPDATFLYTFAAGYMISDKLGVFAESYGFFPEGSEADHRVDGGFIYQFAPVVQWDISSGIGLSPNAPDSFVSTGISFRLLQ
jgi:hypothetical protein